MSRHPAHLLDEDILLLIDLEGSPQQMERARHHLADCPECRERQLALENTLRSVVDFYASERLEADSSPLRLRAQLQQKLVASKRHKVWWRDIASYSWGKTAALVALIFVAGFGLFGLRRTWISRATPASQWAGSIPNPSLTPGAVRPVTLEEVCSTENDDLDPKVSSGVETTVLREYGVLTAARRQAYQIDYLVNPQLGGTSDIKNLWPQSYSNREWNAHAKDELEKRLHQMVCAGSVNLTVAQREIATDWIAAYKKYVHQPYPA